MARFGRVVTAMVTPFDSAGALDLDGARRLARSKLGTAGVLVVAPYYNRPPQSGIEAHVKAVAGATDLPVVVYDIPVRTGRKISTSTLLKLARETKNVVALKDAAGNPGETANVIAQAPAGFEVYSGDDGLTLPLMAVGAVGVIGVATHWSAPEHQRMFAAWESGDVAGARAINQSLLESFAYETGDDSPNPIPSKVMMNLLGVPVGECRLPMGPPADFVAGRAKQVLDTLRARRGS